MAVPMATVGRYVLYDEIASGGMAVVHLGRLVGPAGFAKTVAIKRLHPHLARDPDFVAMFLDEARLAGRIRHPNVVSTLDVVATEGELFVVMEYVLGDSLARLLKEARTRNERVPLPVAAAMMVNMLHGLHAAHEACNERGEPLNLVHRDVSPQNVLVGADGAAHIIDFGVAKAAGRAQVTRDGQLKGKLCYMAPEQLRGGHVDRKVDLFGASIVFWEAITGQRLFDGDDEGIIYGKVIRAEVVKPSVYAPDVGQAAEAIVMRGLARDPSARFATAREMALAIETALPIATPSRVGRWVEKLMAETLASRRKRIAQIESSGPAPDEVVSLGLASFDDAKNIPTAPGGQIVRSEASLSSLEATRRDGRSRPGSDDSTSPLTDASLVSGAIPAFRPRTSRRAIAAMTAVVVLFGAAVIEQWRTTRVPAHPEEAIALPSAIAPAPTEAPPVAEREPVAFASAPSAMAVVASPAPSPPSTASPVSAPRRPPSRRGAPRAPAPRATAAPVMTAVTHAASSPAPAPVATSAPPPPAPAAPAAPDCSPPYTIDADGNKHYKRECASY